MRTHTSTRIRLHVYMRCSHENFSFDPVVEDKFSVAIKIMQKDLFLITKQIPDVNLLHKRLLFFLSHIFSVKLEKLEKKTLRLICVHF